MGEHAALQYLMAEMKKHPGARILPVWNERCWLVGPVQFPEGMSGWLNALAFCAGKERKEYQADQD